MFDQKWIFKIYVNEIVKSLLHKVSSLFSIAGMHCDYCECQSMKDILTMPRFGYITIFTTLTEWEPT